MKVIVKSNLVSVSEIKPGEVFVDLDDGAVYLESVDCAVDLRTGSIVSFSKTYMVARAEA